MQDSVFTVASAHGEASQGQIGLVLPRRVVERASELIVIQEAVVHRG
jgi:hypothetical protein